MPVNLAFVFHCCILYIPIEFLLMFLKIALDYIFLLIYQLGINDSIYSSSIIYKLSFRYPFTIPHLYLYERCNVLN